MTVVLVTTIQRFIGLSTDDKPTPPAGSTFWETDTRRMFIYNGSAWVAKPGGTQ